MLEHDREKIPRLKCPMCEELDFNGQPVKFPHMQGLSKKKSTGLPCNFPDVQGVSENRARGLFQRASPSSCSLIIAISSPKPPTMTTAAAENIFATCHQWYFICFLVPLHNVHTTSILVDEGVGKFGIKFGLNFSNFVLKHKRHRSQSPFNV